MNPRERITEEQAVSPELFAVVERAKKEWQSTFDAMDDPLAIVDEAGLILRTNRAFFEGLGVTPQAVLKAPLLEAIHDDPAGEAAANLAGRIVSGAPSVVPAGPVRLKGNFMVRISPLPADGANPSRRVVVFHDMTETRGLEKALLQEKEFSHDLVSRSPLLVARLGGDGVIRYVNAAGIEILGRKRLDLLGRGFFDLAAGTKDEGRPSVVEAAVMAGAREGRRAEIARPDGTTRILSLSSVRMVRGGESEVVLFGEDITERSALEIQLLQSEKMAAIGQLTAGIVHEINNPVGFISSNIRTLREYASILIELEWVARRIEEGLVAGGKTGELVDDLAAYRKKEDLAFIAEDTGRLLEETEKGIDRIQKILSDLKRFSHPDAGALEEVDLANALESTLNIAWNEIKYKARVEKDFQPVPRVLGYGPQLNQVFLNLLINSAQAIDKDGVIRVGTRAAGDAVTVTISDNGCGMPAHVKARIFEPFFTTKPPGKGTGLGLSITYGIIEKHGGRIEVESEPGRGTAFSITLPIGGPPAEKGP
ncbi:MAG: PAS domain S-box protein [Nitrospirae bacterium]|nr:PAS domain S-box protein [Nitrospirota bacterium]